MNQMFKFRRRVRRSCHSGESATAIPERRHSFDLLRRQQIVTSLPPPLPPPEPSRLRCPHTGVVDWGRPSAGPPFVVSTVPSFLRRGRWTTHPVTSSLLLLSWHAPLGGTNR